MSAAHARAMRVVLVTHYYPAHGGGVERVAEQLVRRIAGSEISVVWCASETDVPPALDHVSCEPMATCNAVERWAGFPYPIWSPGSLRRLASHVRASDAVHVHDPIYFGSLAAAVIARRHGKRLVVTQHIAEAPRKPPVSWIHATMNRVAARWVLSAAEAVAFISPAVQRYFEAITGPRSNFHYTPNGVDADVFNPVSTLPEACKAALGFDPNRPLMLFVGRFVSVKRLHIVRNIAAARPNWQWCVVGHGPDNPTAWNLPNVVVRVAMPQAELVKYYRAADLLVLPSEREGFPLVVQEAMACGLPACITSEVASGAVMPPDLWVELPDVPGATAQRGVAVIDEWIARPESHRLEQRAACARYAADNWCWEAVAQAHLAWLCGTAA